MRLVFISSVTAMTPLRTISTVTGSTGPRFADAAEAGLLAVCFVVFRTIGFSARRARRWAKADRRHAKMATPRPPLPTLRTQSLPDDDTMLFLRRAAKNKHVSEYCPRWPKPLHSLRRLGEPSGLKALQQASPWARGWPHIGVDGRDS
jgi:hypothetical protein